MSIAHIITRGIGPDAAIKGIITAGILGSGGDVTAPTLSSATVNTAGTTLTLAFSEAVQFGTGGNGGFVAAFTLGGLTLTYASGTGTSSLVYNSSRTIYKTANETGTLAYTQPGNGVEDLTGNDLQSFAGTAIVNNSTQTYIPPTAGNAKHGGRFRNRMRTR